MQGEIRQCQNCKQDFVIEPEDFGFYEKMKVPPPTFCPSCRLQRRLAIRNERNFYKRKCELCGKDVISMYSEDKPFPLYCHECWWSDKWDPMSFGAEYDFSKPFFEQYKELFNKVPRPALIITNSKNCEYCNYIAGCKDSYLCFGSIEVEDCMYGCPYESKFCVDTYLARESEYCYECTDCEKLSQCSFCQECTASYDLLYCYDCKNCHDCIGCAGLRSKEYYIFNKPYSKEEYQKEKEKILAEGYASLVNINIEFEKVKTKTPHRFATNIQCKDVSGDHIVESKNAKNCFDVKEAEDTRYSVRLIHAKDVHDSNYCEYLEMCYDYLGFWKMQRSMFSNTCGEGADNIYSDFCAGSSDIFGCVVARQKQYCILNKQYTKEEYNALVSKIIEQMNSMPYIDKKGRTYKYGEYFPAELSPFCYNESVAAEFFPLTKEEALARGYTWKDKEKRNYSADLKSAELPNHIKNVEDSIVGKVIECEHYGKGEHSARCGAGCTEAFKITPSELSFYRRMNLPVPHLCPNCRHYERLAKRNPFKLWHRSCMCEKAGHEHNGKCKNEFETSYALDRSEIVYCERCYQKEVY